MDPDMRKREVHKVFPEEIPTEVWVWLRAKGIRAGDLIHIRARHDLSDEEISEAVAVRLNSGLGKLTACDEAGRELNRNSDTIRKRYDRSKRST